MISSKYQLRIRRISPVFQSTYRFLINFSGDRVVHQQQQQIGGHLKGLDVALEALAKQQQQQDKSSHSATVQQRQKTMLINQTTSMSGQEAVTSVTVSLPSSKRASRRGSVSEPSGAFRSRRNSNSMDLYSADYSVRLSRKGSELSLQQKSACHIRVDDSNASKIKLCSR